MSALRVLDFSSSAIDSIWAMTAFILHLGNVQFFNDENDTAGIRNMDLVDKVGLLLLYMIPIPAVHELESLSKTMQGNYAVTTFLPRYPA